MEGGGSEQGEHVNEGSTIWSTEQTEINRSSREDMTQVRVDSYDLSPLNRSLLQADDESGILKPIRGSQIV